VAGPLQVVVQCERRVGADQDRPYHVFAAVAEGGVVVCNVAMDSLAC